MIKIGYIYKITNKVNGKIYVGMTLKRTPEERFKHHVRTAKSFIDGKYNHKSYLYSAMNKYGIENFIVETIEYLPTSDKKVLGERESYHISQTPVELSYNIAPGGYGGNLFEGHQHTDSQ